MSFIDFILNIVCLLLWLNWRAIHLTPVARPGSSLVATLKPATPPRSRWLYLGGLFLVLLVRGLFYWQLGPALPWHPRLPLGPTTLIFRIDSRIYGIGPVLLFSALSFCVALAIFYVCLLLLSSVNSKLPENNPHQRFVQLHLGWIDRLPGFIKMLLPLLFVIGVWYFLQPVLAKPQTVARFSQWHLVGQGALIAVSLYMQLQYFLLGALILYTLNSYVYFGLNPFWNFVDQTGRNLLRPLQWEGFPLAVGKVDFTPIIGIALLIVCPLFAGYLFHRWGLSLPQLFQKLAL